MWAVVIVKSLDIFWALQKGKGCLRWIGLVQNEQPGHMDLAAFRQKEGTVSHVLPK